MFLASVYKISSPTLQLLISQERKRKNKDYYVTSII